MAKRTIRPVISVRRALRKLGEDINTSRRLRRITMESMAGRTGMSRVTIRKIEKGDSTVSMGHYAMV